MSVANSRFCACVVLLIQFLVQSGPATSQAAERWNREVPDNRDEATLRKLFAPAEIPRLPVQIARPFDTGPQVGRSRLDPPPLDVLDPPLRLPAPPTLDNPIRMMPPEFVEEPAIPNAYECDSFEGQLFERPRPPEWCPYPWLWPFSNAQWTWVQGQGDSLGFVEFEKRFLFTNALLSPFRIIPGFMTRYVSGPDTTDLPADLVEFSIEVAATYQVGDVWTLDVGIRPGLNGDFYFINSDTFRMQGHVVAARQFSETIQEVIGFVYLDREDIPALPIIGVIWQPNPGVKCEFVFPRPRLAMRVGGGPNDWGWVYVRSELGGNSWTIERASGAQDIATYRDIRLCLGYETLLASGFAANVEVGWVFSRHLAYDSGTPDFNPHDTCLLRAGISF